MIGLSLACTMAIVGRVGQGQRRPDDRGELRRRLRRQLALRPALLAADRAATWPRSTASSTSGRSASRSPAPGRTRRASARSTRRPSSRASTSPWSPATRADLRDGTVILDEEYADEESLSVGDTYDVELADGPRRARGGRHLRREPDPALPGRHHAADPHRGGLPRRRQLPHRRHRRVRRRCSDELEEPGRRPADRDGQGPAGVRRGAAGADRPAGADDLRAAGPRPADRRARHRQHAGALDHRAHARGRACCGPSA